MEQVFDEGGPDPAGQSLFLLSCCWGVSGTSYCLISSFRRNDTWQAVPAWQLVSEKQCLSLDLLCSAERKSFVRLCKGISWHLKSSFVVLSEQKYPFLIHQVADVLPQFLLFPLLLPKFKSTLHPVLSWLCKTRIFQAWEMFFSALGRSLMNMVLWIKVLFPTSVGEHWAVLLCVYPLHKELL